jgi:isopenicillin-N N-acyltransferase-like protein
MMTRFREIEAAGAPRELGRQIGEVAGEEIRAFCDRALTLVNKSVRVSADAALAVAEESLSFAQAYAPNLVEELRGTGEAAGVSLTDLMLLQVRNQLHAVQEAGCTSLALAAPRETSLPGGPARGIVAQNWDNDPALDPFTVVLTRRPRGKPPHMTIAQAGLIGYIGFNAAGIGLCLNTLPAPSRRVGVPHYFTVRRILESASLAEAVESVQRARRAIPANIMMITPQGPADLEVTIDDVHVLSGDGAGAVTHANHCRHPKLLSVNGEFPELIQSHARQERIDQLFANSQGGRPNLADVQAALRDHNGHPRSICRHSNGDPGTGFLQTVFSVIMEPAAGRMHATRGTPCTRPYETYRLK